MQIISKSEAVILGLKKYFTGKPCKQGHISEKYTNKSTCVECLRLSSALRIDKKRESDKKRYHSLTDAQREKERTRLRIHAAKKYKENPDILRKRARKWRLDNLEKCINRVAEWRKNNRDELLKKRREQYAANPLKFRRFRTDYYARNTELEKSRQALARSKNMVFYNKLNRVRLAKIKRATPLWADQLKIDSIYFNRKKGFHVDHIVPITSNLVCGLHNEFNLQYLSMSDNIKKGNRYWPDMP